MASIQERNGKFIVVYDYRDETSGKRKQKWVTCESRKDAEKTLTALKRAKASGSLSLPLCSSLEELLQEYIDVYGKSHWGESSYMRNIHLIEKYIVPMIGSADPIDMNVRCLDHIYQKLQCRHKGADGKVEDPVAPSVLRDINKLLKSCFHQAIRWEIMDKNPAFGADLPHCKSKERPIWDLEADQHPSERY